MDVKGKKLLILGGTAASLDLVKVAKEMGVYTIVTDEAPINERVAKQIADDVAFVSTTNYDGLISLIKEKGIDGAFCGPSEFNLRNLFILCEKAGLPCYTNSEIWNRCANKDVFREYCIKYGVDCPQEYNVDENTPDEVLREIEYPIIVKPVDGSSSSGITVCSSYEQVREACKYARSKSLSRRIIVEKYIQNISGGIQEGAIFGVRYLLRDGEAYPYFMMDTYIVDPIYKKSLISGFTCSPSKHSEYYLQNMDQNVRKMLKGMGLSNGVAFFQALPANGKIYFHEMGYRLSGGLLYKLTEPLANVNDMKMMIRFALGDDFVTSEELSDIRLDCKNRIGAQLMIPLCVGTIGEITGINEITSIPEIVDFIQYYHKGDTIEEEKNGTLAQHFGRISMIADSISRVHEIVTTLQTKIKIKDINGNIMNCYPFDLARTQL